ncbi:MAG: thiamine pyrophosphate-binding protein [Candidatus Undinarchaeales archaeon]|jgi:3D-(3,5/4)-trihydroxycyclohexane-1,2-dione acylhydrolase (decyclizing)|nr:thiamine pyrophosphate-binding protein [Candidatus Undinarchaeales archaeon]MDP7493327.1 thiamine pyrophosphate-binding protein [Candidatus Undinarchaeales archaeon]
MASKERNRQEMTASQAIVRYLIHEGLPYVFGIFGHGNVQLGEALKEHEDEITYIQLKNEQNGVHMAIGYAKMTGRPLAVTTSIGPGCTNLVTGAGAARVNRLPVLLLPGDAFADAAGPLLQQVEGNACPEDMASDTLRPVSRYWTRITRPEQLARRLPQAFDAMLEPGNEGPATLALPMDTQTFSHPFDVDMLFKPRDREWERTRPDERAVRRAAERISKATRPLIIAGGGVIRSEAWEEVIRLAERICAPVVSTQAGNGTMLWDHHMNAFTVGPDGSSCGNRLCKKADLVIGIGTRYGDFTTCSDTLFGPDVEFVNLNICNFDVGKQRAVKLLGDARESLRLLLEELTGLGVERELDGSPYYEELQRERREWMAEVDRVTGEDASPMTQNRVIGVLNEVTDDRAVIVSAAGSLPGHLLRLWKTKDPTRKGYHCEYAFSTMGYEVAGGMGVKLADPSRDVYVMVGDASFLMAPQELVTAVQEGIAVTVVLVDNHGPQVIRNLQASCGFEEFGCEFKARNGKGLDGGYLNLDFAGMAESMGCVGLRAANPEELKDALATAREVTDRPTLIHVLVEPGRRFLGCYDGWWDVPRPVLSDREEMRRHRAEYERVKREEQVVR